MPKTASPATPGGKASGAPEMIAWTGDAQEHHSHLRIAQRTVHTEQRRPLVIVDRAPFFDEGGRPIWLLHIAHDDGRVQLGGEAPSLSRARQIASRWRMRGYTLLERGEVVP